MMYKGNMGCPLLPFSVSQIGKDSQALTMSSKNCSCMPGWWWALSAVRCCGSVLLTCVLLSLLAGL